MGLGVGSHYPELPGPGPRKDMGWVWNWVLGLDNITKNTKNVGDFEVHIISPSARSYCKRKRKHLEFYIRESLPSIALEWVIDLYKKEEHVSMCLSTSRCAVFAS